MESFFGILHEAQKKSLGYSGYEAVITENPSNSSYGFHFQKSGACKINDIIYYAQDDMSVKVVAIVSNGFARYGRKA